MRQQANNYATALYELTPDKDAVDTVRKMFEEVPLLSKVLADPMISMDKKHRIIDALSEKAAFPVQVKNFVKYLCDHRDSAMLLEIIDDYDSLWEEKHNILKAELLYAKSPEKRELDEAGVFLKKKYPGKDIRTTLCIQEDLLGGMCIRVGHTEYDWSYEGRLRQLERKLTVR